MAITSLILEMHQNGTKNLEEIMSIMLEYFEIDAIAIMQGDDWKMTHWIGKYIAPEISMKPPITEQ